MISNCPNFILQTGDTHQMIANIVPEDADDRRIVWKSSNPAVASVNDSGLISALTQGSVKITVTADDGGYTKSCNIGVMGTATVLERFDVKNGIRLYPNPTSDKLYVEFSEMDMNREIIIFDSRGQMIHKESAGERYKQIDITSLNTSGVLVVKIKTNNQCNVHKICVL